MFLNSRYGMEKVKINSDRLSDTFWDCGKFSFEKDRTCGFSWPQRNYRCSFCKKEFKSAQALGGHMNVHRRDRAKMRLSPSRESHSLNTNPNPNVTSSSPPSLAKFLPYMTHHSSLTAFSSPSSASTGEEKLTMVSHSQCDHPVMKRRDVGMNPNKRALFELRDLPAVLTKANDYSPVWKKKEMVGLDLSMGSLGDAQDDLDLELRLGLS